MTGVIREWKKALEKALEQKPYTDRQRRSCRELRDQLITIKGTKDLEQPLKAIRSVGWYYPETEELESIMLGEDTQHIYSFSRNIAGQLPRIIRLLRENPETRRALLHLADPALYEQEEQHLPVLISAHFTIKDKTLYCTVHARSVDLLVGFPANIYQAGKLAEHVAKQLEVKDITVSLFINSAHVFDDYEEQLQAILQNA